MFELMFRIFQNAKSFGPIDQEVLLDFFLFMQQTRYQHIFSILPVQNELIFNFVDYLSVDFVVLDVELRYILIDFDNIQESVPYLLQVVSFHYQFLDAAAGLQGRQKLLFTVVIDLIIADIKLVNLAGRRT